MTINNEVEEYIVIDKDRNITVPKSLQRVAVQFDHNAETLTFNCPRYWDGNDLSTMYIYVNYLTPGNKKGRCLVKNITIDDVDENLIHFNWLIGKELTLTKGKIKFLVCAIVTDEDGNEKIHWNTELCDDLTVSEGLEAADTVEKSYPDIINDLLTRMDNIIAMDEFVVDTSLSQNGLAAEAKATRRCYC